MVRICLLVLAAVWLGMGASLAQARVALIIGNSDYHTPGWQLANPANDAELMGEALEEIGFEVHTLLDADETAMETAFRDHGERLAAAGPGTVGVFFYAGHGVQSEGLNYLVPVDLRAQTEADVWAGAPRLDNLFRHLRRAGNETNFIILDACRNNPLLSSSRNVSGGLAAATERDARGMLIAYATEPGAVTEDGAGQANSPYTTALADLIREPGLSAEALFRRVATRVEETTDDRQRPWIESGLRGRKDFCFAGCDLSDDAADWQRLSALNTAASFQAYMGLHPAGAYVAEATAALAELGATATSPALRGEAPPGQTRAIGEGSVAAPTGPITGIRLLRVLKADDCVDLGGTAINECSVFSAAFNPTRDQVATSSFDGKARLWNPKTGLVETTLTGHRDRVYSVGYSPDGARLVTSAQDGSARVWDVATGSLLTVLTGHTRDVRRAVFSPDGRRIVTASDDGSAWVWDANDGAPLLFLEGHEALVVSAAVSPDGTRIATASNDYTARLWDAETGEVIRKFTGHERPLNSVVFSPDGTQVLTSSYDETARIWNTETGELIRTLTGHEEDLSTAVYSPDGQHILTSASDDTARIWNAETGEELAAATGHAFGLSSASFSADGRKIITSAFDGTARIWALQFED